MSSKYIWYAMFIHIRLKWVDRARWFFNELKKLLVTLLLSCSALRGASVDGNEVPYKGVNFIHYFFGQTSEPRATNQRSEYWAIFKDPFIMPVVGIQSQWARGPSPKQKFKWLEPTARSYTRIIFLCKYTQWIWHIRSRIKIILFSHVFFFGKRGSRLFIKKYSLSKKL